MEHEIGSFQADFANLPTHW